MKKEIKRFKGLHFFLKTDKELSKKEKKEMHDLLIKMYPTFKSLYDKHGYYSTVKPQMNFLIKDKDILIGTGKFLWREIKAKDKNIRLFAFGVVVDKKYQNKGLGTELIRLNIKEAKKRNGSILYGSTSNKKMKRILNRLGFKLLKTPVFYKNTKTKKIEKEKEAVYIFELKRGLTDFLESLQKLYIGFGPI